MNHSGYGNWMERPIYSNSGNIFQYDRGSGGTGTAPLSAV